MNVPPNPHAEEARAAMREAIRPLLANPPIDDDAAILARAAATWPRMGRYLSDAHIGIGLVIDRERGVMVTRETVVIEVKGDYPK